MFQLTGPSLSQNAQTHANSRTTPVDDTVTYDAPTRHFLNRIGLMQAPSVSKMSPSNTRDIERMRLSRPNHPPVPALSQLSSLSTKDEDMSSISDDSSDENNRSHPSPCSTHRASVTKDSATKSQSAHFKSQLISLTVAALSGWALVKMASLADSAGDSQAHSEGLSTEALEIITASSTEAIFEFTHALLNNQTLPKSAYQALKGAINGIASGTINAAVKQQFGNQWSLNRVLTNAFAGGFHSALSKRDFICGFKKALVISCLTYANFNMRQAMVAQSQLNPDNIGKNSMGLFNDRTAIAGTRRVPNPDYVLGQSNKKYLPCDGPAGGCQGPAFVELGDQPSRIGPIYYSSNSVFDQLAEAFAGPHDWLSDCIGMYDPKTGNGIFRQGLEGLSYEILSYILIPPSAPFAAAALIDTDPCLNNIARLTQT